MSRLHLLITSVALVFSFVLFTVAQEDSGNGTSEVRKLQTQKLELLQELLDRYKFGYSSGKPVLEEVLAVEQDLLNTRLEMAITRAERVAIRESIVDNRRKLVEARVAGLELGNNPEVDILFAKVERIDAEIALSREKATPGDGERRD
jgi:hypothetical protein